MNDLTPVEQAEFDEAHKAAQKSAVMEALELAADIIAPAIKAGAPIALEMLGQMLTAKIKDRLA